MNIAVFASGGGSNFQVLIDKCKEGKLHCTLGLMVGNNSKAKCFERALNNSIPCLHIAPSHFQNERQYSGKLLEELTQRNIELIVLAGYMKKIPAPIIKKYSNRIINIHPALLPSFGGKGMYGKNVHQAVLDYGAKVTGITVHFVDEEYDHGTIILQETVKVAKNDDADSLAARVLLVEHENYWKAIEAVVQGTLTIEGRKVIDII